MRKYKSCGWCIVAFLLLLSLVGCVQKKTENTMKKVPEEKEMPVESETVTEAPTERQTEPETTSAGEEDTTNADTTKAETDGQRESVSFLFAGDVCLEEDGFVLDYFDETGGNLQACVDPQLLQRMNEADLFMLNHEYSISSRGSRLDKYYTFRARPERMEILKQMSVDIVSLANNHVYDYGYDAFQDTLSLLDAAGIRRVGAGMNRSEAEQVQYFDIRDIRIGVVAASRAEKYVITPNATDELPGVFWMYDDTRLKEVIADADSQCDFLVAYLHWGTEDSEYFEQYQQRIAQDLVDLGVDAIIGGHPHVLQGMEYVGDVPVLYSMGDFWFNGEDKYSVMAELNIFKDGSCNVNIIPCRQKNYTVYEITDTQEINQYFDYMDQLSPNVEFSY